MTGKSSMKFPSKNRTFNAEFFSITKYSNVIVQMKSFMNLIVLNLKNCVTDITWKRLQEKEVI